MLKAEMNERGNESSGVPDTALYWLRRANCAHLFW